MSERYFYSGRTGRDEASLTRELGGWRVWSIDEPGDTLFYAGEEARARAEYEARVARLIGEERR